MPPATTGPHGMNSTPTWELAAIQPGVLSRIGSRFPSHLSQVLGLVDKIRKRNPNLDIVPIKGAKDGLYRVRHGDFRALLKRDGKWLHLADIRRRDDDTYKREVPSGDPPPVPKTPTRNPRTARSGRPSGTRAPAPPRLFDTHRDEYLCGLGVNKAALPLVREFRNIDDITAAWTEGAFQDEVAVRLLGLADGKLPTPPTVGSPNEPDGPPNAQPVVFVIEDERLKRHLDAPWERWITFLSREQRKVVEMNYRGPAKVTGTAGTGKTLVALHRAARLAEGGHKVLLTTFGATLARNLERSLSHVIDDANARRRITVSTVHSRALAIVSRVDRDVKPADDRDAREALEKEFAGSTAGALKMFTFQDVVAEWEEVIQRQGIVEWKQYLDAKRHGRGEGMTAKDRELLWPIFEGARRRLSERRLVTWRDLCLCAAGLLREGKLSSPFGALIVDEVQDLSVPGLRFLWELGKGNPANFMVVGDAGQRIYPGGYSLRRLGIEVRGRSERLRTNYRTTRNIRVLADRVGHPQVDDLNSGTENRRDSGDDLIGGPEPAFQRFRIRDEEQRALIDQIKTWVEPDSGLIDSDIAVFVRTNALVRQISRRLAEAGLRVLRLKEDSNLDRPGVRVGTMHRAKGLEFKAVWVAAVDGGLLPLSAAVREAVDEKGRENVMKLERSLLYVAMTRARHRLTVSWSGRPSQFLPRVH